MPHECNGCHNCKAKERQATTDKINRFKIRVKVWANSSVNEQDSKEGSAVNYHWGQHSGMVSMAREVEEFLKLLDKQ